MQETLTQADPQKQLEKNNSQAVHADEPDVSKFPRATARAASGGGNLHYFLAAGASSGGGILRRYLVPGAAYAASGGIWAC